MKHFIVAVVSVGALIALPGLARALTPEPVIATPLVELQPAATEGYLAYSQNSSRHPNRLNLYVRPDGQPRFRVNPRRTVAFAGLRPSSRRQHVPQRANAGCLERLASLRAVAHALLARSNLARKQDKL